MKFCVAVVALSVVAASAYARPDFWDEFVKHYSIKEDSTIFITKCQTCHTARPPQRNDYGRSIRTAYRNAKPGQRMPDVFKAVEDLDSDKDGTKNGEEIKAGTLPGDAESKPAKKDGIDPIYTLPLAGILGIAVFGVSARRSRTS
ncbi:MAG: hypothetical protein KF784_15035 [Fimbriimonadaceae bacterium]|nr:hypothetical protein [Fimbriimonadaceae bacterium]